MWFKLQLTTGLCPWAKTRAKISMINGLKDYLLDVEVCSLKKYSNNFTKFLIPIYRYPYLSCNFVHSEVTTDFTI